MKWTESKIQKIMFHWLTQRNHSLITPNKMLSYGEADLVSVSSSNLLWEFEVKCSLSDYRADKNKKNKHDSYHRIMQKNISRNKGVPNKFFYVVPDDLAKELVVPQHAGLIVLRTPTSSYGYHEPEVLLKAPQLHSAKVTPVIIRKLCQSLSSKLFNTYWKT